MSQLRAGRDGRGAGGGGGCGEGGALSLVMQQEFTGHASHYKQTAVA